MLNLVHFIAQVVLNNTDRQQQYLAIQLTLGCTRYTAKKLLFAWIYRAEHTKLMKLLIED